LDFFNHVTVFFFLKIAYEWMITSLELTEENSSLYPLQQVRL
jgi:hypothetical protein